MNEVIDTTQAPSWFGVQEPEEIKYWRAMIGFDESKMEWTQDALVCYSSERSAWIHREKCLSTGNYFIIGSYPLECTMQQINERAISLGARNVVVRDETGQTVEQWSVL